MVSLTPSFVSAARGESENSFPKTGLPLKKQVPHLVKTLFHFALVALVLKDLMRRTGLNMHLGMVIFERIPRMSYL